MYRNLLLWLCLLLAVAGTAVAEDTSKAKGKAKNPQETGAQDKAPAAKQLSGMSIVGNDEAPKSLFIVPWKQAELGSETSLNKMLTESAVPVDREEFLLQLDLYEVSTKK